MPERLVFIDETWTKTSMFPLRGWCRRGGRLHAKVPHGHWKTMTFVAALRCEGIDAPGVFDRRCQWSIRALPEIGVSSQQDARPLL